MLVLTFIVLIPKVKLLKKKKRKDSYKMMKKKRKQKKRKKKKLKKKKKKNKLNGNFLFSSNLIQNLMLLITLYGLLLFKG
jgi:hypothetical protein